MDVKNDEITPHITKIQKRLSGPDQDEVLKAFKKLPNEAILSAE